MLTVDLALDRVYLFLYNVQDIKSWHSFQLEE